MRPISLVPELVPAVLDGRKTQSRRPMARVGGVEEWRKVETGWEPWGDLGMCNGVAGALDAPHRSPFGEPGDRLWLRERARVVAYCERWPLREVRLCYVADGAEAWVEWPVERMMWEPRVGHCVPNGVHREGSRCTLEVLRVWVERVQSISEADAQAEGIDEWLAFHLGLLTRSSDTRPYPVKWFNALWDRLYPGSWERNEWVWACEWKRVQP